MNLCLASMPYVSDVRTKRRKAINLVLFLIAGLIPKSNHEKYFILFHSSSYDSFCSTAPSHLKIMNKFHRLLRADFCAGFGAGDVHTEMLLMPSA